MSEPAIFGLSRVPGRNVDDLLREIATELRRNGRTVAGYVQERIAASVKGCPGLLLHDLSSGAAHSISEKRGPGATGCNLDWGALTERAADLERRIAGDSPTLVIVSRFGKAEVEGRGFCSVIEACIESTVPVLVAHRPAYSDGWATYHGGLARELAVGEARAILAEIGLDLADYSDQAR